MFLRSAIACAVITTGCFCCLAGDGQRFETYLTADYGQRSAALATSTVWSAFGPLDQPGFRLKADGFASLYGGSNANIFSSAFMAADLKSLGDVMAGYQIKWDDVWIKLYAGAAAQAQIRVFWQIGRTAQEQGYGAVAAIETYWHGSGRFWASANLSWLQFNNTGSFYERVAYEVLRDWEGLKVSAGMEASAMISNADKYSDGRRLDLYNTYAREGALLNVRYRSHDLTLSGGFSEASDERSCRPYATLSYGVKF